MADATTQPDPDETPGALEPEASINPTSRAIRIEWCVIVGALVCPMIVSALLARYFYGEDAAAAIFAIHPLYLSLAVLATACTVAVLLLYILHLRGVLWTSIGLACRPTRADIAWGIGLFMFIVAVDLAFDYAFRDVPWLYEMASHIKPWKAAGWAGHWTWTLGLIFIVAASIANGAAEELIRGYVITRTGPAWGGGTAGGAWASVFLFFAYHTYYTGIDLLLVLIFAVVFAGYFVWRRDVWAMIIAHALIDIFFLVGMHAIE